MKVLKYRGKFLGGIYLHSICKRESRAMHTPKNLLEKPAKEKNHDAERFSTKSKGITRSSQHYVTDLIL